MSQKVDLVLIGTGVAPLIAALEAMAAGLEVLIINPEHDFFVENNELPIDPFWPLTADSPTPQQIRLNHTKEALEILSPHFPGAIETWPRPAGSSTDFHDEQAPHIRSRQRVWVQSPRGYADVHRLRAWDRIEDLYVECSDAGLNPQELDGPQAARYFPGCRLDLDREGLRGIALPNICDLDLDRYRWQLLEYVQHKMDAERLFINVSQFGIHSDQSIKFHAGGQNHVTEVDQAVLFFWTPRMNRWISQVTEKGITVCQPEFYPRGIRLWEEWAVRSKDSLSPDSVGVLEDMFVWSHAQGCPGDESSSHLIKVLRAGPMVKFDPNNPMSVHQMWDQIKWDPEASFGKLSYLFEDFLGWHNYTLAKMNLRTLFEWSTKESVCKLEGQKFSMQLVGHADGPLLNVLWQSRQSVKEHL